MKTRKKEIVSTLCEGPEFFTEMKKKRIVADDSKIDVMIEEVSSAEISEKQQDPRIVTLTKCLADGVIIDPSRFINLFNITDVADLDHFNNVQNSKVLEYLTVNQEKIKSSLKSKSE